LSSHVCAYLLMTVVFLVAGGIARAQSPSPVSIGSFRRWNAFTASATAGGKMCFAASQPTGSTYQPNNVKGRDPAYFMVTTDAAKKVRDQISTIIGYSFARNSKVVVVVDGTKFTLFTDGDTAWIEDPAQEPGLVDAIRHGKTMTVQGTSARGTTTTDTYALDGSSAALAAVAKACPASQ
jgi:hypothetical protein